MGKILPGVGKIFRPAQPTGPVAHSVLNPPRLKSSEMGLTKKSIQVLAFHGGLSSFPTEKKLPNPNHPRGRAQSGYKTHRASVLGVLVSENYSE